MSETIATKPARQDCAQEDSMARLKRWAGEVQRVEGWSLSEWARRSGVSRPVISGIANGSRTIQLNSLIHAAAATSVPLPLLVTPADKDGTADLGKVLIYKSVTEDGCLLLLDQAWGSAEVSTSPPIDPQTVRPSFAIRLPNRLPPNVDSVAPLTTLYVDEGSCADGDLILALFPGKGGRRMKFLRYNVEDDGPLLGNIGVYRVVFIVL